MAASNQPLVRGPITSRDWFSLRLQRREGEGGMEATEEEGRPVESVEHLYGDEDGEGHGHGVQVREYLAAV